MKSRFSIWFVLLSSLQVISWKYYTPRFVRIELQCSLRCIRTNCSVRSRNISDDDDGRDSKRNILLQPLWSLSKSFSALFFVSYRWIPQLRKYDGSLHEKINRSEEIRPKIYVPFVRSVVGVMLVMSLSVAISKSPSCEFIYLFLLWIIIKN